MQTSPAHRLMSRRTKTLVPIATYLLYSVVTKGVPHKIQQKRQLAKSYHDRKVKVLLDLDIGQEVHLAPTRRGSSWKKETYTEALRQVVPGRDGWRSIPGKTGKPSGHSRKPQLLTNQNLH